MVESLSVSGRSEHVRNAWLISQQLLSVSAFTVASILITSFFYYMRSLKPGLSVYINGFLSLIWMAGFALLTWNISVLLGNVCNVDNWDHDTGIMICRIYKALETFSITGM